MHRIYFFGTQGIFIGDARTFLEGQWLHLGKGAAVVMKKICVALRIGARREAPSRLRVLPAQGPLWIECVQCKLASLAECYPHRIRQTASPLERAPGLMCASNQYGVLVDAAVKPTFRFPFVYLSYFL